MTILRKAAVLVAALVLVALAAPSAFAQLDQPGLNPEIEIPGDRGVVYDGPPIPNALLARYIMFPTNEQKRRRNLTPPVDPPESGGEDVVHAAGPSHRQSIEGGNRHGSLLGVGQGMLTPQQGVIQPRIRAVVEELEDELRGAQDELGLR